jgi:hypothetical protein
MTSQVVGFIVGCVVLLAIMLYFVLTEGRRR